jgi:hypothetical protein
MRAAAVLILLALLLAGCAFPSPRPGIAPFCTGRVYLARTYERLNDSDDARAFAELGWVVGSGGARNTSAPEGVNVTARWGENWAHVAGTPENGTTVVIDLTGRGAAGLIASLNFSDWWRPAFARLDERDGAPGAWTSSPGYIPGVDPAPPERVRANGCFHAD